MCTLIALHRCVPDAPLVVAANRDEFFERPSEGLALRDTSSGIILAPRDERSGGTWLGLNASGLFAAVTNLAGPPADPARRSRGLLVLDVLAEKRAAEAADGIERVRSEAYNPFNLLVADRESAHLFSCDGALTRIDLEPGAHVIGNARAGDLTPKLVRQRARARRAAGGSAAEALEQLAALCRDHAGADARSATCVHAGGYGTRSSALLRLGCDPGDGELRYADGAPCESPYRDFTPLLRRLGRGSGPDAGEPSARKSS